MAGRQYISLSSSIQYAMVAKNKKTWNTIWLIQEIKWFGMVGRQ